MLEVLLKQRSSYLVRKIPIPNQLIGTFASISFMQGKFIAITTSGEVAVSEDDGVSWSVKVTLPIGVRVGSGMTMFANTFHTMDSSAATTQRFFRSSNLVDWQVSSSPRTNQVYTITSTPSSLVAGGNSGYSYVSTNGGITWADGLRGPDSATINQMAYDPVSKTIWATKTISSTADVIKSSSPTLATTWSSFKTGALTNTTGIAIGNGLVVIGDNDGGIGAITIQNNEIRPALKVGVRVYGLSFFQELGFCLSDRGGFYLNKNPLVDEWALCIEGTFVGSAYNPQTKTLLCAGVDVSTNSNQMFMVQHE